jgi:hypothetical protein
MVDRELTHDIRRLVEDTVPPAPWLEDRVMAAVTAAIEKPGAPVRRPDWDGRAVAAVAALVIAALVVGVLVGSRLVAGKSQTPAGGLTPSRDTAVATYRAVIGADANAIDLSFQLNSRCQTRAACARALAQTRTNAEALLRDISGLPTPAAVAPAVLRAKAAAEQFIVQLDVAVALIQQPNSDYIAASLSPTIHDLDLSVAAVDCWPATPVDGDHGIACS